MNGRVNLFESPGENLPQPERCNHRSINLAGGLQTAVPLKTSERVSSRRAHAAIDRSMVVSCPGQGRLDLAHAGIPGAAVVFRLCIFFGRIAVIIIRIPVGIASPSVSVAPEPRIDDHPGVVVPMAAVTMPNVVAAPIPISALLCHDAALAGNALGRQRGPPVSRKPLISREPRISRDPWNTRRVDPGIKSGRAIDRVTGTRNRVGPVAIRRLRRIVRRRTIIARSATGIIPVIIRIMPARR